MTYIEGVPGRRNPLRNFIQPQLSLLVKSPPAGSNWVHEYEVRWLSHPREA